MILDYCRFQRLASYWHGGRRPVAGAWNEESAMQIADLPPTLTVEQAGRLLGISRSTAYKAAERGELPTITLAGRMHVPTRKLLALVGVEARPEEPAPADAGPASSS